MFVTLFLAATMPLVVLMVESPKKKTPERPAKANVPFQLSLKPARPLAKRGPKSGSKKKDAKTQAEWYIVCQIYQQLPDPKPTHKQFLMSARSGKLFEGTQSEIVSFGRKLKEFKSGNLKPSEIKKRKQSEFPEVEEKLVAYLDLRATNYLRDKCGGLEVCCCPWCDWFPGFK